MIDPVLMYHIDRPTDTTFVERDAYRNEWYVKGWRSDDDPSFTGTEFDDLLRFAKVPPAWGETWRPARQLGGSRLVRVLIIGASICAGEASSSPGTTSWYALLRSALQAKYGNGGTGFMSIGWRSSTDSGSGVTFTGAWTDTAGGGPPATSEGGIGSISARPTTAGNGATMTFTFRGTSLDIFTKTDPAYGRVDYNIDGAGAVQVPLNSAVSIKTTTINGLTTAQHSVVLTAAAGDSRIFGVRGRNATGVIVENVSTSGRRSQDMVFPTTNFSGHIAIQDTIAALGKNDLVIIALAPNDIVLGEETNIQDLMWNAYEEIHNEVVKSGLVLAKPPDIVTLIEHIGTADTIPGFGFVKRDWLQASSVVRDFSDGAGAALIDYWGAGRHSWDYWAAKTYWGAGNTDGIHPNDAGHQAYASPLIALLT